MTFQSRENIAHHGADLYVAIMEKVRTEPGKDDAFNYVHHAQDAIINNDIALLVSILKIAVDKINMHEAFQAAIYNKNISCLKLLTRFGAVPDVHDIKNVIGDGYTPLVKYFYRHHPSVFEDAIRFLLNEAKNVNSTDSGILHRIASMPHDVSYTIDLLIKAGFDIHGKVAKGRTPLHLAIMHVDKMPVADPLANILTLIKHGADIFAPHDYSNPLPFDMFSANIPVDQKEEMIRVITEAYYSVNPSRNICSIL